MNKMLFAMTSFALAAPLLLGSPAMAQNAQQDKMKQCNADAAGKKGDERKAFMSSCLKKEQPKPATQQDKMKQCNADAAGKKGDERKAFMSSCLKKDK